MSLNGTIASWNQTFSVGRCSPVLTMDSPSFSLFGRLICIFASGMMCDLESLSPLWRFPDELMVANAICGGNLYSEPLNTPSVIKLVGWPRERG